MTMNFHRSPAPTDWAQLAGAFALGAVATFAAAWAIERLRPGAAPGPISDDIVRTRVRERIGELVSRPDAVAVSVENGVVRLAGELEPEERDALLTQLIYLPGVMRLRNALAVRRP